MKIEKETKKKFQGMARKVGFKVHCLCKNMETRRWIPHDTIEKPQQPNTQKATRQIKEVGKKRPKDISPMPAQGILRHWAREEREIPKPLPQESQPQTLRALSKGWSPKGSSRHPNPQAPQTQATKQGNSNTRPTLTSPHQILQQPTKSPPMGFTHHTT